MAAYLLNEAGEVITRSITHSEFMEARAAVKERWAKDPYDYSMRSCWVCNPAHSHFLANLKDGFIMLCFDCGRWYYQGVDLVDEPDVSENEAERNGDNKS